MGLQFRVRPMEPADLEHLWTMQWDPLPRQISTFYLLCTIGHPRYCSVAVGAGERIIGVLLATPEETGRWLYVNHLRVEPECRQFGVGAALMKNVEAQCRASGVPVVWLVTSADVEPYYAPMGYVLDASFMPPVTRQLMARHRAEALILSKRL